jgi:spore coat protein U-like protein
MNARPRARRSLLRHVLLSCAMLLGALLCLRANAAVSCSVSATGPAFGIYNPLQTTPTYANGVVTANCTWLSNPTPVTVTIVSSYSTGAGTFALRKMVSGTSALNYNLFYDDAYSQIRGDGTGGSQQGGGTIVVSRASPTGSTSSVIYGRIPARQDVASGAYNDTIIVTISY